MKKMKRLAAMLLALVMVLGMSITAFAAPEAPESVPTAEVEVRNVVANSTVMAYQIVTYQTKGQYDLVIEGSIADLNRPTDEEILELAGQTDSFTSKPLTASEGATGKTTYTGTLEAGMWLVLVSGSNEEIYNPMIVSVRVDPTGTKAGTVDADGRFNEGTEEDPILTYAKSSKPTLDKTVDSNSYELNDRIKFTVTSEIPSYADNYETVTYTILDELSENLQYVKEAFEEKGVTIQPVTVTVGGEPYAVNNDNLDYDVNEATNNMKLTIASDTALAHRGEIVTVEYYAELTADAKAKLENDVNLSTNKVTLDYSNNPLDASETTKLKDKTNQYTFGIDALLNGSETKTPNFVKTDNGEEAEGSEEKVYTPLPGAEFELVENVGTDEEPSYQNIPGIANVITGNDGLTTFVGLEAGKTYYIHEVKAPQGYVVRDDVYVPVIIEATYKEVDGVTELDTYEIKVGGETVESNGVKSSTYTWTNPKDDTLTGGSTGDTDEYNFTNTNLAKLPSTGGIGTTIFTIGGCLIMIIAAGLFFASRRKSSK